MLTRTVAVHTTKVDLMERNIHKHFDHARIRGEWFEPVDELVKLARAKSLASA